MQVILMEKVVNLGGLGDIVKVKDGYARNYLIPQGKAKRATEENKKVFEAKRAELEKVHAEKLTADAATVSIPGAGNVIVQVKDTLKATIFGAGSVQYSGDPKVTKTIRGAGSVTKTQIKKE